MKDYILKRLFWMTFTLFGIMVITFSVTRMAPGDPALLKLQGAAQSKNQQLSRQIIEETRKLYGFDKPLLFNFRRENIRANTLALTNKLFNSDPYIRDEASTALLEIGIVTVPYLIEIIPSLPEDQAKTVCALTCDIINITTADSSEESITRISAYLKEHSAITDTALQNRLIKESYANPESWQKSIQSLGSALLPQLLETGLESSGTKQVFLLNSAAEIARKPWILTDSDTTKDRSRILNRWKKWWNDNKYQYTFFSPTERFFRIFSATQFGQWFGMVLTLDFGESYSYHLPVLDLIKERLPISLQLSLISIFLTYIIAIPLGVFSATHQFKLSDKIITVILFILYSLPSFWLANMLILFTTGGDFPHIFPSRYLHSPGADSLPLIQYLLDWAWHLVLPITCLTYASFAYISRQMRVGMLDVIRQDFIRTARAKGLSEHTVIFKHALRNALIPTVTLLASLLPALLGGSVIIEEIFTIEGMGKLSFDAILNRDYPIINAIAFFSAFLTLLGMLLTDIAYVIVDPRISFEK
jgi:peptide/nickel transport system permease protein